jgi:hypothetical protein
MVREDANNINDDTPYMGGQVRNIDTENMVVTMVAHRGWAPDGKTIYYIITDATPEKPANMMGVPYVPADEQESNDCDSAYSGACIPPPPPDLDCKDISHKNFNVKSPDPHRLDGDGDGKGCET